MLPTPDVTREVSTNDLLERSDGQSEGGKGSRGVREGSRRGPGGRVREGSGRAPAGVREGFWTCSLLNGWGWGVGIRPSPFEESLYLGDLRWRLGCNFLKSVKGFALPSPRSAVGRKGVVLCLHRARDGSLLLVL